MNSYSYEVSKLCCDCVFQKYNFYRLDAKYLQSDWPKQCRYFWYFKLLFDKNETSQGKLDEHKKFDISPCVIFEQCCQNVISREETEH